jgi:hypothetical protein
MSMNTDLTRENLEQLYSVEGKTVLQIASDLGTSPVEVYEAVRSFGLQHLWADSDQQPKFLK